VSRSGSGEIDGFSREYRFLLRSEDGLFGNQRGLNLGNFRCLGDLGFGMWRRVSLGCGGGRGWFRNRFGRRLDHHGYSGRRHGDYWTLRDCGSLGNHRFGGRARGNGRRLGDNGRRGTRLGNNLARFRPGRRSWRLDGNHSRRRRMRGFRGRRCFCSLQRQTALAGFVFLFLLLGLNGFQHIAWLGDMREINLRGNGLRGARGRRACRACLLRCTLKLRANLVGLILLQRTGVSFASAQAKLCQ
jgi:hypothetical protein